MSTQTYAGRLETALEAVQLGYFSAGARNCNFGALAGSEEHAALRTALAELGEFDPRELPIPGPLAFWLNVYNGAALLGVLGAGVPASVRDVPDYFSAVRARIAGHAYSLDDIEHGLLRGNVAPYGRLRAPMRDDDPRLAFTPRMWDERVHFAMHCACRSSPALRVLRPGSLAADLDASAREYLRGEVEAVPARGELVVPQIFKWYGDDFGGRDGILAFVVARLDDQAIVDFIDRGAGELALAYRAYDWSLNSPRRDI